MRWTIVFITGLVLGATLFKMFSLVTMRDLALVVSGVSLSIAGIIFIGRVSDG